MQVVVKLRGHVASVRLTRPEKSNALSAEMMRELESAFAQIDSDRSVRAVILVGSGDTIFCAGTDIGELSTLDPEEASSVSLRGQSLCKRIEKCRVPVIAAVNGVAAGGGWELAMACHLRVASEDAIFNLPETRLGVIPGYGGTQRLARIIGTGRALEFLVTEKKLTATEALRLGLVNRVVRADKLNDEAESLALEISKRAPLAISACLEAVRRGIEMPLDEGLALERELFSQLFETRDMREGTRAFLEKRNPEFIGE